MRYLLIILSFSFLFSCSKQEAMLTDEDQVYYDSLSQAQGNFAFIYENDVYYMAAFGEDVQKLSTSPDLPKREIRISHDGTKIAYIDTNEIVNIISNTGTLLDTFWNTHKIIQMDWSIDDASLYYVNDNNEVKVYGETIDIPNLYLPKEVQKADTFQIISLSMSSDGSIAYIINYGEQKNASYFRNYQVAYKVDDEGKYEAITNRNAYQNDFQYLNYTTGRKDLVVGYGLSHFDEFYDQKKDRMASLDLLPDEISFGSSTHSILTPCFKSDIGTLVSVQKMDSVYQIKKQYFLADKYDESAFHEGSLETSILEDYQSTSPIYIDWK